jgi:hypothetical protein
MRIHTMAVVTFALLVGTTLVLAATRDDAVVMVKKTAAAIKAGGVRT